MDTTPGAAGEEPVQALGGELAPPTLQPGAAAPPGAAQQLDATWKRVLTADALSTACGFSSDSRRQFQADRLLVCAALLAAWLAAGGQRPRTPDQETLLGAALHVRLIIARVVSVKKTCCNFYAFLALCRACFYDDTVAAALLGEPLWPAGAARPQAAAAAARVLAAEDHGLEALRALAARWADVDGLACHDVRPLQREVAALQADLHLRRGGVAPLYFRSKGPSALAARAALAAGGCSSRLGARLGLGPLLEAVSAPAARAASSPPRSSSEEDPASEDGGSDEPSFSPEEEAKAAAEDGAAAGPEAAADAAEEAAEEAQAEAEAQERRGSSPERAGSEEGAEEQQDCVSPSDDDAGVSADERADAAGHGPRGRAARRAQKVRS